MPRQKKQTLKKRPDGRYACRYKNEWFYGRTPEEALAQREEFKEAEKRGVIASYFVSEYALKWFERAYPNPAHRQTVWA